MLPGAPRGQDRPDLRGHVYPHQLCFEHIVAEVGARNGYNNALPIRRDLRIHQADKPAGMFEIEALSRGAEGQGDPEDDAGGYAQRSHYGQCSTGANGSAVTKATGITAGPGIAPLG